MRLLRKCELDRIDRALAEASRIAGEQQKQLESAAGSIVLLQNSVLEQMRGARDLVTAVLIAQAQEADITEDLVAAQRDLSMQVALFEEHIVA